MVNYSIGDIVTSTAGRDAGKNFVVIQIIDEPYVLIADGVYHKLASPKKKKIKHLVPTGKRVDVIAQKLEDNLKVFDSEVRNALLDQINKGEE